MIVFNLVCIVMCIVQVISIELMWIGRFGFGFAAGVITSCAAKMLDEIIPVKLIGLYGPATSNFLTFGFFNSMILGLILPSSQDKLG